MSGGAEAARTGGTMTVLLTLRPDPELDPEAVERLTRGLRAEVAELDVESVRPPPGEPAPPGAKGDPVTVGALIVALSASGGVLTTLIGLLRHWLDQRTAPHRIAVTIDGETIELDRASASEREALLTAYLRRHAPE
jgi:hypothetical protein